MQCTHLSLVNFRNYVRLELDLDPAANVVVGANAQGKSNLLEAIYCLATTKSFRVGPRADLLAGDRERAELRPAGCACRPAGRAAPARRDRRRVAAARAGRGH